MRTFEEQRREFVELALKFIKRELNTTLHKNLKSISFGVFLSDFDHYQFQINIYSIKDNESEIQKLRDLVGELG